MTQSHKAWWHARIRCMEAEVQSMADTHARMAARGNMDARFLHGYRVALDHLQLSLDAMRSVYAEQSKEGA